MLYVMLSLSLVTAALLLLSYLQLMLKSMRNVKVFAPLAGSSKSNSLDAAQTQCQEFKQAPGPMSWPIVGNLALLGRYKVPFQAFTELAKEYGDIYSLTLGSTRCIVVNNLELIREVLNQNGKFFGGRPDFLRYNTLFGGDRGNSLALCDWSNLQQKRRNLARRHCSPRDSSSYFNKMSNVGSAEIDIFMDKLNEKLVPGEEFHIKPLLQQTCANMFSQYMCSVRFDYEDKEFQTIVSYFDEIFWEINQGYAVDFLPWLAPFYKKHVEKLNNWSISIRKFILGRVINEREQNMDFLETERDFTDALLKSIADDENVSRDTIMFMLEDFIGGHSAVGNLVMLALSHIAKNPQIAKRMQEEADRISEGGKRNINLYDMESMPYTVASISEVLRYSSSPIVPHVATEDAIISGYGVTTGTVVFINNYILNTSEEYWSKPEQFNPERFLETVVKSTNNNTNSEGSDSGVELENHTNTSSAASKSSLSPVTLTESNEEKRHKSVKLQVKKNIPHFLPFSIGKRTCIGQNLVRGFGFVLLSNIMRDFNISSKDFSCLKTYPACVALPTETFPLLLSPRSRN